MPPALPIVGLLPEVGAELVAMTVRAGLHLDLTVRSGLVREFLLAAATPMPRYGSHEVGAGFLDESRMVAWLSTRTALDLVQWFSRPEVDPRAIDERVRNQLADTRVFDADGLGLLAQLVRSTGPVFFYDWRTQRSAFAPFPSEAIDDMDLDRRINGLEVT